MITSINDYKFKINESNFKLFKSIDKMCRIFESEQITEYEWDLTKDVEDDLSVMQKLNLGKEKIQNYIYKLLDKFDNLSNNIKLKIFKTVVLALVGVSTLPVMLSSITNYFSDKPQADKELVNELKNIVNQAYINTQSTKTILKDMSAFNKPNTYSNDLLEFLKHEEGSIKHKGEPVLTAYDLGDGMITIGFGHAERKSKTKMKAGVTKITYQQALDLLTADIKDAQNGLESVLRTWKQEGIKYNINQGMYDSMVSMIYNMGIGNFRKTEFIKQVKSGNYEEAKTLISKTNVSYPGHIPRRAKETEMFNV